MLLALVLIALAAPRGAGALTTSVNSWVRSGDTIVVDDQSFAIYLSTKTNEIVADYGKGSLFIKNNSCEATLVARVCLDNIQYDITEKGYKIRVRGISLAPVMTVTRTISKNEFFVGDSATFSVTLKNTGGLARNVTFLEVFSKEFEVAETDGIRLQKDRAAWTGKLDTDETKSFTYTVKSTAPFDGGLVSSLVYNDGLKLKTVYSSKLSVKTTLSVELKTFIGDDSILVGEKTNFTVNVSSKLPESAVIDVSVFFDEGLNVISRPYDVVKNTPFSYSWSGSISKTNKTVNLSKALFFGFKGAKVGNSNIRANVTYRPASQATPLQLSESKQSVLVSNKGIKIRTSAKDATFEANQLRRVKIFLQNLNPYAKIRDVSVNTSTSLLYLPNSFLPEMEPEEQVLIADKSFYAPDARSSEGYIIYTNVSYFTEFGDNFSQSFKDTVTVAPAEQISLLQSSSPVDVKPGNLIDVSVTANNQRRANFRNIRVFDNVSPEFEVIGKNYGIMEAKSKEAIKAYSYKLKAPYMSKETVLYINTTMEYSEAFASELYQDPKSYVTSKSTPVTVRPDAFTLTLVRSIDDSSIYAGETFIVRYVITNPSTERTASKIFLSLPLSQELDLVDGEERIAIPDLEPGETYALSDSEKRRAKRSGSHELGKAALEYENEYGDSFSLNGTATTISVKDNYVKGPVIIIEKTAPGSVNNTDSFDVKLKVRNIGTQPAAVSITDEGVAFRVTVENGTEYLINRSARQASPGTVALPRAAASYSYQSAVFRTGSDQPSILVVDNPVLVIAKEAPSTVTNIEPFPVLIRLANTAQNPVVNVTVTDGSRSWNIDAIPANGYANLTYDEKAASAGESALGPATATYAYEKVVYTSKSNSPVVKAEEKKLLAVRKSVSPGNATRGSKVKVTISVESLQDDALEVAVYDGKKSFAATLKTKENRTFSYDAIAGNETAGAASASYNFRGQNLTAFSPAPDFFINEESGKKAEADAGREKGSFLASLGRKLLGLLTWKRGG